MKEFLITKDNEGQRLDKYLARIIGGGGMSFIFKMLRKKNFVLNDKKATGKEVLKAGDTVKLYIADDTYEKFKSELKDIDLNIISFELEDKIVYEDKDIILVNKPANLLSQKADINDISLNEIVLDYLLKKGEVTKESLLQYKPSCVNRLDRNTTGIIIVAKSLRAAQAISSSLKDRTINKYYKCIVEGRFSKEGLYKGYLTKDDNNNTVKITDEAISEISSYIETEYKCLKSYDNVSEVEVHLITGKPHQIRAHISNLGFPIIGDRKYGKQNVNSRFKAKNQLLHAYKVVFPEYEASYEFVFSGKTFVCEPKFRY